MRVFTLYLCLLLALFAATALAGPAEEEAALLKANAAAEALDVQPTALPTFPNRAPAGAIRAVFNRHDDRFNIAFWRQNNHAWIEIRPINSQPFVCSSAFDIIQRGVQYDTVRLVTRTDNSQCGDVLVGSVVLWFTQWSFTQNPANLASAFTIVHDAGWRSEVNRLAIPSAAPGTVIDPPEDDDNGYGESGSGCFINTLKSNILR